MTAFLSGAKKKRWTTTFSISDGSASFKNLEFSANTQHQSNGKADGLLTDYFGKGDLER
jgi:hypothetical protein